MSPTNNSGNSRPIRTYPGVYVEEIPSGIHTITDVATSVTAFIGRAQRGPLDEPVAIHSYGDFEHIFGGLRNECPMSFAVDDYFLNGGTRALIVRVGSSQNEADSSRILDTSIIGNEDCKTGLYAFGKVDPFNILCIPPSSENDDVGKDVFATAADYCEKRRAMLIVDCPQAWTTKEKAKSGISDLPASLGTSSKNTAVFFPRIRKSNPLQNGKIETFAPCGAIAGVFARTDTTRGVWKAPAGLEADLKGVTGLSVALTDAENEELNSLGCNCLRVMPTADQVVIWGARTLQGNDMFSSEWKYISVRRLALFIEESLNQGLKWVVFEPNDEPLWAKIRLNVNTFMLNLFRQGAFSGTTPNDAYFVKCDSDTTTQNDINLGIVNIQVGFAPLKPREFIILRLQQIFVKQ